MPLLERNPPAVHRLLRARSTGTRSCRRRRVVPLDDPTLLFTNAGMNQFKAVLPRHREARPTRARPTRRSASAPAASTTTSTTSARTPTTTRSSRCSATGPSATTSRRKRSRWAWELLTEVWKLDPTRLHVTVFEGDPANGVPRDDEAAELLARRSACRDDAHPPAATRRTTSGRWATPARAARAPRSTRPHAGQERRQARQRGHDRTSSRSGTSSSSSSTATRTSSLTPLPAKHVDTGMGFERITAVLQGKTSNYDTDVFTPIFEAIQKVTRRRAVHRQARRPEGHRLPRDRRPHPHADVRADRRRRRSATTAATTCCSSILRRAERYGVQVLGTNEPFLHELVPAVVEHDGRCVPGVEARTRRRSREQICDEEESFLRTLDRGIKLFDTHRAARCAKAGRTRDQRRGGVRAARHLRRASSTSPSRWRPRTGPDGRRGRLRDGDGGGAGASPRRAARSSPSPPCRASCRRPTTRPSTAPRPITREGARLGEGQRGRAHRASSTAGDQVGAAARPHQLLRRAGRAGRRHAARSAAATGRRSRSRTRSGSATPSCTSAAPRRRASRSATRSSAAGRRRRPHRHHAQPHRDAPAQPGAAARCSASTSSRRARSSMPRRRASTSATTSRSRRSELARDRAARQRADLLRPAGDARSMMPLAEAKKTARRAGRLRREVPRPGARAC